MTSDHDPAVVSGEVVVPGPRRSTTRETTRERVIDAAVELTMLDGWAAVTMAKLAERAKVSRQTVYNDIGTKAELAEAMILREIEGILACVSQAFEAHPRDLLEAIREASYAVLDRARDNQLLRAVVGATHGADTELVPLLTSHSHGLLGVVRGLVRERVEHLDHGLTSHELDTAIDAVVRVVLSHAMQPSDEPAETADAVAWLAGRVLRR